MERYDLIVIGSGPAGRRAAIQAAKLGQLGAGDREPAAGRRRLGAYRHHPVEDAARDGAQPLAAGASAASTASPTGSRRTSRARTSARGCARRSTTRSRCWSTSSRATACKTFAGRRALRRSAHASSSTTGERGAHRSTADKIVIAVGTRAVPARRTCRSTTRNVFDSDDIATEPHVPRSLTVVGAGVIGIEYATIFSALDVPVTIIEPREQFPRVHRPRDHRRVRARPAQPRHRSSGSARRSSGVELDASGWAVSHLERRPRACAPRCCSTPPAGSARRRTSTSRPAASTADNRGRLKVDPKTFQTDGAAHLCRRRRDRLSEPRLDLDGAGPHRRLPRLRRADAAGARVFSLRHLRRAGDLDRRADRGAGAREGHRLRSRHRALPRDLARAHHGPREPA